MKIPSLFRAFRFPARTVAPRRPQAQPAAEGLEDRMVLSTVFLVPNAQPLDSTHRHTLPDALTFAGPDGTVIVEPGTTPEATPVVVSQPNITIMGDPAVGSDILQSYDLAINAGPVTLTNLHLGNVTVGATGHNVTVTGSHLVNFTETGGTSGVGNNTIRHNLITGAVSLGGNSDANEVTGDYVDENEFVGNAPIQLQLTNSNQTAIRGNHFIDTGTNAIGIQVRSNSEGVVIVGNTVDVSVGSGPVAVLLLNTGGASGNLLSAQVLGNHLSAGGNGTGIYCNIFGNGAGFVAQIEGNQLNQNKVGIDVNGITGFSTGAGNIDIGGGSNAFGTSKGGNNFRGFDGQSGHYAINLHNTDAGITVSAQGNIFDNGINTDLVVRDSSNGGGTGVVDVSNALDPNHAFVQSLFTEVVGRASDPAQGGELDQWVGKLTTKGRRGVAKAILLSNESVGRMVNDVFSQYLDRDVTLPELTKFANQLKLGKDITVVEGSVLGSVEYQGRINSNYIQALYQDLLHRPATTTDVSNGYKTLQTKGLKGVAITIAKSKERRLDAATDFYRQFLHRDPTAVEASALATKPGLLKMELQLLSGDDFFNHG